jgi:RNA polymerase nonessential primary-like sigma factor
MSEEEVKEAATKEIELEAWKRWKKNKSNENLKSVLDILKPTIEVNTNKMTGNLPRSAVKAQMIGLTIKYLDDYDSKKSKLNTYIENTAGQKLHRYVYEHQNLGTIPEPRISKVGTYNRVRANLEDGLGRPPTPAELGDELKWSKKQVMLFQKELRRDLVQDSQYVNIYDDSRADIDEHLSLLHSELYGTDKQVMEHLYGLEGKAILTNSEIANKLGISQSMVTQIKTKLANRLRSSGALTGY